VRGEQHDVTDHDAERSHRAQRLDARGANLSRLCDLPAEAQYRESTRLLAAVRRFPFP